MIARAARSIALVAVVWPIGAGAAGHPLHVIDHVSTTQSICANVVVHANAAIDARVKADGTLAVALVRLRSDDFDDDLTRRDIVGDLVRFASTLADSAARGSAETKRLLALADDGSPHGSDLRTFAEALARTFEFDRKSATLLASLPATLQVGAFRESPREIGSRLGSLQRSDFDREPRRSNESDTIHVPTPARTTPPGAYARSTAIEIESGVKAVSNDESRAAEVAEAAVTGC
jgi:hypothetical protein